MISSLSSLSKSLNKGYSSNVASNFFDRAKFAGKHFALSKSKTVSLTPVELIVSKIVQTIFALVFPSIIIWLLIPYYIINQSINKNRVCSIEFIKQTRVFLDFVKNIFTQPR